MNVKEKAIKIEQLKDERDKATDALWRQILTLSRQIDNITGQMYKLGCDRQKLYNELTELKKQKLRNEDHYDLLIRAQQAINGDKNE